MRKHVIIEKMDIETEEWSKFFSGFAEINKSSGNEYFNARTEITKNTYNFKMPYIDKLKDIKFNTVQYRIVYDNNIFNIINVDDPKERHLKLTLVGKCNTI